MNVLCILVLASFLFFPFVNVLMYEEKKRRFSLFLADINIYDTQFRKKEANIRIKGIVK